MNLRKQLPQAGYRRLLGPVLCVVLLFFVLSCSSSPPPRVKGHPRPYKIGRTWYQPLPHSKGFVQTGLASWYGKGFHGKPTANGETYNMHAMTAAHKTLPLGTHVKVCHEKTGRCQVVRINDRGPFVRGRVIDLSHAAAKKLGIVGPGTGPVKITAIRPPKDLPKNDPTVYTTGDFTVQVGAFGEKANADRLASRLSGLYKNVHVKAADVKGRTFYRVRVGLAHTLDEAEKLEQVMVAAGFTQAFVVAQ